MNAQDTKLEAWQRIQPSLGEKQQAVYALIREATQNGFDMTDVEIARALRWTINRVTPRRNELMKQGLIVKSCRRFNADTKCRNWAWKAKP